MTTTVHHPSCPQRHDPTYGCLCSPEARADDVLILMERSPDAMLLDVIAHAARAAGDLWEAIERAPMTPPEWTVDAGAAGPAVRYFHNVVLREAAL